MFAVAANNVPGGLVDLFHGLQVAIMLALMVRGARGERTFFSGVSDSTPLRPLTSATTHRQTNILQFAWWKCKAKRGIDGHWDRYGPCYLLIIATVLVMIQPTCMLVIGSYGSDDDTMPCPHDDATEPINKHHGMENFFFEVPTSGHPPLARLLHRAAVVVFLL